jgi:hypothetical protein
MNIFIGIYPDDDDEEDEEDDDDNLPDIDW